MDPRFGDGGWEEAGFLTHDSLSAEFAGGGTGIVKEAGLVGGIERSIPSGMLDGMDKVERQIRRLKAKSRE